MLGELGAFSAAPPPTLYTNRVNNADNSPSETLSLKLQLVVYLPMGTGLGLRPFIITDVRIISVCFGLSRQRLLKAPALNLTQCSGSDLVRSSRQGPGAMRALSGRSVARRCPRLRGRPRRHRCESRTAVTAPGAGSRSSGLSFHRRKERWSRQQGSIARARRSRAGRQAACVHLFRWKK